MAKSAANCALQATTDEMDARLREQLIKDYTPMVMHITRKIKARLPASVEVDDLMSAGYIGLMDAIDKYDPYMENKFKTYAEHRIRGAILDELRSFDEVPRSIRDKIKQIEKTTSELEHRACQQVSREDVASALGLSIKDMNKKLQRNQAHKVVSIDHARRDNDNNTSMVELADTECMDPLRSAQITEFQGRLSEIIDHLPERQRLVLALYYYEDMNMKEIAEVLDVSESRVSQLRSLAVDAIRRFWLVPA